ncbi:hypothetical protein AGOR_G00086520 [Albula goreensis]|uniref:Secreted protein n=1 Tax=Albula goreensis TaxID=1534307 RepID=A0A8T3DKI9_9TELE|nr:hypothetical protein AGOR_G00086520 [Albula goreensis]
MWKIASAHKVMWLFSLFLKGVKGCVLYPTKWGQETVHIVHIKTSLFFMEKTTDHTQVPAENNNQCCQLKTSPNFWQKGAYCCCCRFWLQALQKEICLIFCMLFHFFSGHSITITT